MIIEKLLVPIIITSSVSMSPMQDLSKAAQQPQSTIETEAEEPEEIKYSDYEFELLADMVQAEAGSESDLCKVLVADVVINRMNDTDFPSSIYEVITQSCQFACVWDGGIYRHPATDHTKALVKAELESVQYPGVIYFRENYFEYGTPWKKVDSLYFSTK